MADEPPRGMERRLVHRVLHHWRGAEEERGIPSLKSFLARDLGDMRPALFVLKVADDLEEPEVAHIGQSFLDEVSNDLVGKPISAVPDGTLLKQALAFYSRVVAKKVPITLGDEFVNARGQTILYRSIILPLSEDGEEINFLLCAANCKVKEEES